MIAKPVFKKYLVIIIFVQSFYVESLWALCCACVVATGEDLAENTDYCRQQAVAAGCDASKLGFVEKTSALKAPAFLAAWSDYLSTKFSAQCKSDVRLFHADHSNAFNLFPIANMAVELAKRVVQNRNKSSPASTAPFSITANDLGCSCLADPKTTDTTVSWVKDQLRGITADVTVNLVGNQASVGWTKCNNTTATVSCCRKNGRRGKKTITVSTSYGSCGDILEKRCTAPSTSEYASTIYYPNSLYPRCNDNGLDRKLECCIKADQPAGKAYNFWHFKGTEPAGSVPKCPALTCDSIHGKECTESTRDVSCTGTPGTKYCVDDLYGDLPNCYWHDDTPCAILSDIYPQTCKRDGVVRKLDCTVLPQYGSSWLGDCSQFEGPCPQVDLIGRCYQKNAAGHPEYRPRKCTQLDGNTRLWMLMPGY